MIVGLKVWCNAEQRFHCCWLYFTYILMHHDMIILYFRLPYFHVSNSTLFLYRWNFLLGMVFNYSCWIGTLFHHRVLSIDKAFRISLLRLVVYILAESWLLAALDSLCIGAGRDYIEKLFFPESDLRSNSIKMNLWYYGERKTVDVQTSLPTKNKRLDYLHSSDENVFWSALVRKMYIW